MKIISTSPVLYSNEIKKTVHFYTDVLDFKCLNYEENWGWAVIAKDNARVMISLPNSHIPFEAPHFSGSIYFTVQDVNSLCLKIKDHDNLCYPIENFEYGMREFAIYDNNGYLLQFGEELEEDTLKILL